MNCKNPLAGYGYQFCRFTFGDNTKAVYSTDSVNVSHTINGGAGIFKLSVTYCQYNYDATGNVCYTDGNGSGSIKVLTGSAATGDTAYSNGILKIGGSITSSDKRFYLVYQGDGNLVLYRKSDNKALWASNTVTSRVGVTIMQGDGNLVIYDTNMVPYWASNTAGNSNARLVMQSDGNLVIYRSDNRPIWATNTVQP